MVRKVSSLKEFRENFKKELSNAYNRTIGVRLLLVDDFQALRDFNKELERDKRDNEDVAYLEDFDFAQYGKNWLSQEDIRKVIKSQMEKRKITYLFSVDNILRFYSQNDFYSFLTAILRERLKENEGYVILVLAGLYERIQSLIGSYGKYFYKLSSDREPIRTKLFVFNPRIEINIDYVDNFKDFLRVWRLNKDKVFVKLGSVYEKVENAFSDSAVDIIKINSEKKLVEALGFEEEIPFASKETVEFLVDQVLNKQVKTLKEIISVKSFKEFVLTFLNEKDEVKKQILMSYVYNYFPEYRDLLDVDKITFIKNVYLSELPKEERENIISIAIKKEPSIEHLVCEEINKSIEEKRILGLLECEQKQILKWFKENKITAENLRRLSNDFNEYLYTPKPSNLKREQEWIIKYFELYKLSKLSDKVFPELENIIQELNKTKESFYEWYYSFNSILETVQKLKDKVERIIWIDALGFEWSGLIQKYLESKNIPVWTTYICRANIPSITTLNKPNFEVDQMVDEFDRLIHKNYNYPDSIVEQIRKLKDILNRYISPERRTIIFSDHGSSALVRLYEPCRYEGEFEQYGRYAKYDLDIPEALVHKDEETGNVYTIAKTHKSLKSKPPAEVHGGATPEEILTFVMVVGGKEEVKYKLIIRNKQVNVRDKRLRFTIKPMPASMPEVRVNDKSLPVKKVNGEFVIDIKSLKPGKHILKIIIDFQTVEEEIHVVGGFEERDLL